MEDHALNLSPPIQPIYIKALTYNPLPKKPIKQRPKQKKKSGSIKQNAVSPVDPSKHMEIVLIDMYTGHTNCPTPEKNRK